MFKNKKEKFDHTNITDLIHTADKKIIKRGWDYFVNNKILNAVMDFRLRKVYFKVQGSSNNIYQVIINDITSPTISVSCTCPYPDNKLCKHEIAALFYLRENFNLLLEQYNQMYYPEIPNKPNKDIFIQTIEKAKKNYPEFHDFGFLLFKYNHVKLLQYNPILQIIDFIVDDKIVRFKYFNNPKEFDIDCDCHVYLCKHSVAALYKILSLINENKISNLEANYLRSDQKPILIGKVRDFFFTETDKVFPTYLPEEYKLIELKHNYVKLEVKARYKPQIVKFFIQNKKIYSQCTCNDNVRGLCKHQIAAMNLLTELDYLFFEHLADPSQTQNLNTIFT